MCVQFLHSGILCYIRENSKCKIKISTPTPSHCSSKPKSQGLQHKLTAPLIPWARRSREPEGPPVVESLACMFFPHQSGKGKTSENQNCGDKTWSQLIELNGTELSGLNNIFSHFWRLCCSVTKSCLTLCDPMDYRTPGSPVFHYLPEFAQTHAHWISDEIQPSHPLSPSSPPTLNLPQH